MQIGQTTIGQKASSDDARCWIWGAKDAGAQSGRIVAKDVSLEDAALIVRAVNDLPKYERLAEAVEVCLPGMCDDPGISHQRYGELCAALYALGAHDERKEPT